MSNQNRFKALIAGVFLLGMCSVARSAVENDSVQHHKLKDVVVTAKQFQTLRAGLPMQQMDSKQLQLLNATNISDVVTHFSGTTVKDYGGIGGQKTVSLRGLGAHFTAVSFDGFVSSNIQSGQIDLGKHSLSNVAEINLYNGHSNDIFNSARSFASGGLLEIKTKLPDTLLASNEKYNSLKFKTGSFGLIHTGLGLAARIGKGLSYNFNVDAQQAHGRYKFLQSYGFGEQALSEMLLRNNTALKSISSELNVNYNIAPSKSLFFKSNISYADRELPGSVVFYNNEAFQELTDRTINAGLRYSNTANRKMEHKFYLHYQNAMNRFSDKDPNTYSEPLKDRYLQEELYVSFIAKSNLTRQFTTSVSADWWYNQLDLVSNVNFVQFSYPTRHTALLNVASKYFDERWHVSANLLFTQTFEATKYNNPSANRQKLAPTVAVSYNLLSDQELRLRAFYKNTYRLPTFNDLYYQKLGNANLQPENAHQYNVGITYVRQNLDFLSSLSMVSDIYYNQVLNKIIAIPRDMFHWGMSNKSKVEVYGMDMHANMTKAISAASMLRVMMNYTLQLAKDKSPYSATYGEQIPYTPIHSGSSALSFVVNKMEFGYNIQFSGTRYSGQIDRKSRLKPYQTHSINIRYKLRNFKLNFEYINVFNTQYEIVQFYPMPRANFRYTLQYFF